MNTHDGKKDNISSHSIETIWNLLANFFLVGGIVGGFFTFLVLGSRSILAASIFIGLAGLAFFKSLVTERELRYIWFVLILPLAIGISLAIYPFANPFPGILGGGVAILFGLWFFVLRYPPQFRAAAKAMQSGAYTDALNLLSQAINAQPTLWEGYQLRAVIYLKLFNSSEAERDARKALQLRPNNHICLMTLGNVLMAQQRFTEADDLLSKALESEPNNALNHYNKGLIYYRLDNFPEAVRHLQFAINKGLTGDACLLSNYYLGCSLSRVGDIDRAGQYYDAMKRYNATFEKLLNDAAKAPDYPGILVMRREFEDMKRYM